MITEEILSFEIGCYYYCLTKLVMPIVLALYVR